MKTFTLFPVVIFTAITLTSKSCSCSKNHDDDNYYGSTDSTYSSQIADSSVSNQFDMSDSIKIVEDRRIKKAQIAEDSSMKATDANNLIDKYSKDYMEIVSPVSGSDLSYDILTDETTYNSDTETLTVTFQTKWDAQVAYVGGSYETHILKGQCVMYGNGQVRINDLEYNDALQRAIKATIAMDKLMKLKKQYDDFAETVK
ncbi:hypothetical protein [Chryseobacterium gambrini]|uniref:hypothetical protein n=1 Tax=Chryseobacterium gambrini TaxID=373672 RepID=UPI003D0B5674